MEPFSLVTLVLVIAIVGFLCWLILQLPMPPIFRNVIIGVISIFLIIWLLQHLGVRTPGLPDLRLMK